LQKTIFLFYKEDKGTNWRLWMSNDPLLEILIKIFMKHCKFALQQIIDGSKWRLCSFYKINDVVIWLMLGQGVHIFFLKHILEFLILGNNFMRMWFNIWWRKNKNQECISSCGSLYEGFCSNKLKLEAFWPSCTI